MVEQGDESKMRRATWATLQAPASIWAASAAVYSERASFSFRPANSAVWTGSSH